MKNRYTGISVTVVFGSKIQYFSNKQQKLLQQADQKCRQITVGRPKSDIWNTRLPVKTALRQKQYWKSQNGPSLLTNDTLL